MRNADMAPAAQFSRKMTRILVALVFMFGGCALVFSLLLLMNSQNQPPSKEDISRQEMSVDPSRKKPKKRKKPRPRPKKRKTRAKTRPTAVPQLATALSGMSFGLPLMSGMDLSDAADSVLGDEVVSDAVMNAATVDVKPRQQNQARPTYPTRARSKNIEGFVVLSMLIGKDGRVSRLKILESEPPGVFDGVVLSVAESWEFEPAMYRGQPVAMRATQRIPFKLGN